VASKETGALADVLAQSGGPLFGHELLHQWIASGVQLPSSRREESFHVEKNDGG
jgi:hypothetical protein